MDAPCLIGITTCLDEGHKLRPGRDYLYLSQSYVTAVETAGATPVVVPISERLDILDRIDALVVCGGDDIPPRYYGQSVQASANPESDRRIASDWRLLEGAIDRRLPVLAVCYGMQLLNVVRGGTLVQRLASTPLDHGAPGAPVCHDVELLPGSRIAETCATSRLPTRGGHRQGVATLGEGLIATAVADDGLVEAIELDGASPVVGVQWHPEATAAGRSLYHALTTWAHHAPRSF